jgi:hypothetical protein
MLPLRRKIATAVSLPSPCTQVRSISMGESTVAARLAGAAGVAVGMPAGTSLLQAETCVLSCPE